MRQNLLEIEALIRKLSVGFRPVHCRVTWPTDVDDVVLAKQELAGQTLLDVTRVLTLGDHVMCSQRHCPVAHGALSLADLLVVIPVQFA